MDYNRQVKSARSNSPSSRAESPSNYRTSFVDNLGKKMAYEWKNIYRGLSQADPNKSGKVTQNEFNNVVSKYGVYLTKEDIQKITK